MTKAIEYPRKILDTTRAYDQRFRPNYNVTTSRLNIAIKSRKQLKHQ